MKYVAKVNSDNYLFELSDTEILMLVFGGEVSKYSDSPIIKDFLIDLSVGHIDKIEICQKINKLLTLRKQHESNYNTLLGILENIKKSFEPIADYSLAIDTISKELIN